MKQTIHTLSCDVLAVNADSVRVRYAYSDDTTLETDVAIANGERETVEAAIRSAVAGPKGEEKDLKITWPKED